MRRAARVDANQAAIIGALQDLGATVQPLHRVGDGCPDLLFGFRGLNYLAEVKDGAKRPSETKLRDTQVEWHGNWRGQVAVFYSVADAVSFIQSAAKKSA